MKNRIPDRETELLVNLGEECAEVAKVVCKIQRFTEVGKLPKDKLKMLHDELGDVVAIVEMMARAGFVDPEAIEKAMKKKLAKMSDGEHMAHN